ncbi:FAD/NAD(P)-binding domain-containing protein [Dendrothele bispora CBS 962.96]|uniref:FAD/NAD(P)-binding domain-containing protein n=1 Tax=Dendrothele bispora (strain CBS 962.96) TaxID=1314807 RepID=A0A4S8MPP2_DENBC|nr:FAD/NAD(P)-binding domain-containing protein [Dendrothele bispora CBS 962.96]
MDEGTFDVIVIGTGLSESISAAALSKAGFKVAHLDKNPYYGAEEASLFLDEFVQWTKDSPDGCFAFSRSGNESLPQSRQYSISLSPSVIASTGPLISSLISSGVSRYGGFRLLDQFGIYDSSGTVSRVPGNKEDIFKNKNISLVDKRRLMRFLTFAAGDFEEAKELKDNERAPFVDFLRRTFSLNDDIVSTITYALSHCLSASDTTLPALQRLRRYLRSAGRYGSSPFLFGHYGSSGEIAQGFCRTSAVAGGVYILGKPISSITSTPQLDDDPNHRNYTIHLDDFPDPLTCDIIISSEKHVPNDLVEHVKRVSTKSGTEAVVSSYPSVARCVAIIDRPISFLPSQNSQEGDSLEEDVDAAEEDDDYSPEAEPSASKAKPTQAPVDAGILVFPPSSLSGGSATTFSVTAFIVGDSTMSTPKDKWIIYISTPVAQDNTFSPEEILRPYLDAVLALALPIDPSDSAPTPLTPLFTTFYLQACPTSPSVPPSTSSTSVGQSSHIISSDSTTSTTRTYLIPPSLPLLPLPESPDAAALGAESVFWEAVNVLKRLRGLRQAKSELGVDKTDREETQAQEQREGEIQIESFWPPLNQNDDEEL